MPVLLSASRQGVVLTHGNVLAYVRWHVQYYGLTKEDRVPYMAGISFDASLAERTGLERLSVEYGDRLQRASNGYNINEKHVFSCDFK